jgi:hypothetical protein
VFDLLTLVGWVLDHLSNHCLHNRDIAVQGTTNESSKQRNPEGACHSKDDTREGHTGQTNQRNRFPTVDIGNGAP